MARIIIHVGPHKTGTTSIQRAFYGSKHRLIQDGILYPQSLEHAQFHEQHADIAFLVRDNKLTDAENYIEYIDRLAIKEKADNIVLSSEEFSSLFNNPGFADFINLLNDRWDVDFVYLKRNARNLAYSNIMQHLTGDLGQFAKYNYDIDQWLRAFSSWNQKREEFFRKLDARFIGLEDLGTTTLASRFLHLLTGKNCSYLNSEQLNVSADKLQQSNQWILSYPLRMLMGMTNQTSLVSPECISTSNEILRGCQIDEKAFGDLVEDFRNHVKARVAAIVPE